MLLAANLIDEVQMKIALTEQARTGRKFGSTLVELKFVDENVLAAFLSKQIDIPCISLLNVEIPRKVLRRIPGRLARQCQAIPIRIDQGALEVAMVDPTDAITIQLLETATGLPIHPLVAPESSVDKMIEKLYPTQRADSEDTLAGESVKLSSANDPHFSDLIEDLESGDFTARFERLEERLEQVWTLLEKVLRQLESRQEAMDRIITREWISEEES
jgi:hypothetical protein